MEENVKTIFLPMDFLSQRLLLFDKKKITKMYILEFN